MKEKEIKKIKVIRDAKCARTLLKQGFYIIDIKSKRENPNETVFLFEHTQEFAKALEEYTLRKGVYTDLY